MPRLSGQSGSSESCSSWFKRNRAREKARKRSREIKLLAEPVNQEERASSLAHSLANGNVGWLMASGTL
ncbi:hypothetical protein KQX54_020923 [Cotesia glomerata]|uniref:Uncharacterized protein n=1 Tax=Cotesia glomerata TaxID=32391 RepID=A0AAV7IK53_COTGL|nr:hypothetical protein KQX54_020923 [Cotesia glomerata]